MRWRWRRRKKGEKEIGGKMKEGVGKGGRRRAREGEVSVLSDLTGILPVHGVDGWSRVHVHEVVVVVPHHPTPTLVELHACTPTYSTSRPVKIKTTSYFKHL